MHIDLVDSCNLLCQTCYRGRRIIPNSPRTMPLDLFERIVKKAKTDNVQEIFLHNWTEPLLNPDLAAYVKIVKAHGFTCRISSNLALKNIPHLLDVFRANPNHFWVSLSGFTNEINQINHVNSDVDVIFRHLETLDRAAAGDAAIASVAIWIKFLDFKYNTHEYEPLRSYIQKNFKNLKIKCELVPATGDPRHPITEAQIPRSKGMPISGKISSQGCELQYTNLDINSRGEVELCCGRPGSAFPEEILGNYLEMDARAIKAKKITHPTCTEICEAPRDVLFDNLLFAYWVFLAADYARSQNVELNRVVRIRHLSEVFHDSLPGATIQSHSNRLTLAADAPLKWGMFIRVKLSGPVSVGSLLGSYKTSKTSPLLKFKACDRENLLAGIPAGAHDIVIPVGDEIAAIDAFVPYLPLNG